MMTPPRVLIVWNSFTWQTERVAEATADVFRKRGCEVRLAAVEFTDERYVKQLSTFPFSNVYFFGSRSLPRRLQTHCSSRHRC
jgi:hypothetical protein